MNEESVMPWTMSRNFQSPLPQMRYLPVLSMASHVVHEYVLRICALHPICCLVSALSRASTRLPLAQLADEVFVMLTVSVLTLPAHDGTVVANRDMPSAASPRI